ncbi:MAG: Undecaprenyl-phosphate galactose phosphotransferase [Patescibacteria group bacterium]|nr:Undecaprenyl-phosphate galactose phosphotransferase [Patescibacteria group bacterium]MDQ5954108.1 Undecaprenyl-phosphate galactose phosphotransferase [Patescibacteria group bacterium]
MPYKEIKKSEFYELLKRLLDVFFALVLIFIFSPLIIIVAAAIKLNTPGPVLADTPERVGKNGKPFKMFKFRSMIQNAHTILREDPEFAKLYEMYKQGSYKLKNDPRITIVGKYIRKFSLDEVPQLFNILKGDMSLVGPRAYYPDELREQQKKYPETQDSVKVVLSVKPGLTGYWQVSGRSQINFDKRIQMDAEYVRKRSILYDFIIIARTPWAMISGKGAL